MKIFKVRYKYYVIVGILGIIVIGLVGLNYSWKSDQQPENLTDQEIEHLREEQADIQAVIHENFETKTTPREELEEYEEMSEQAILQEIHKMTHQKIEADRKWGAVEITKERISKLYQSIETREDLEHKRRLLESLSPWLEGDFNNAVEVRNWIWSTQSGTIGKAIRLLTPEEERQFIEQNFE